MGENNCVSNCGRILLVALNILFLIIGFVMLIMGILVLAYAPALNFAFSSAAGAFESSVSGGAGVVFSVDRLLGVVQTFAFILIGLGAFFFIMALLGIIGGCCKVKCVLIVYVILMVLLIVAQIALMVIIFSQRQVIDSSFKDPLMVLAEKYTGTTGKDGDTVTLNFLMISLSCCGVDNYKDFKPISAGGTWNNTYNGNTLVTPYACCVNPKSDPNADCAQNPGYLDETKNNAEKGCYDALWKYIDDESALAIGICSAIIVLQAILVLFAIYIIYREAKTEADFA